jgi:hypothetical protein
MALLGVRQRDIRQPVINRSHHPDTRAVHRPVIRKLLRLVIKELLHPDMVCHHRLTLKEAHQWHSHLAINRGRSRLVIKRGQHHLVIQEPRHPATVRLHHRDIRPVMAVSHPDMDRRLHPKEGTRRRMPHKRPISFLNFFRC